MKNREELAIKFGRNLREARLWAGFSQEALAERIDMHRAEIYRMERGRVCPRLDTLVKLSRALELPAAELLYGIE